jgi:hypothetical protein
VTAGRIWLQFGRLRYPHVCGAMPHVTVERGPRGNPVYQVGGKSFVVFRNPRADATDPVTGERYTDVIVFWVASESDKQAMVQDPAVSFFTTGHFDGHRSVLLRTSRIGELTRQELAEVVQTASRGLATVGAWLSRCLSCLLADRAPARPLSDGWWPPSSARRSCASMRSKRQLCDAVWHNVRSDRSGT